MDRQAIVEAALDIWQRKMGDCAGCGGYVGVDLAPHEDHWGWSATKFFDHYLPHAVAECARMMSRLPPRDVSAEWAAFHHRGSVVTAVSDRATALLDEKGLLMFYVSFPGLTAVAA